MDVGIPIFWVRKVHAPKLMKIKTKMSDWSNNNRYSVTLFSLLLFLFFLLLLLLLLFTKSLCKPKNKDKRDVKKADFTLVGILTAHAPTAMLASSHHYEMLNGLLTSKLNPVFLPARYEFFWNLCFYACEKSYQTLGKFSFLYSESSEL